MVSMQRLGKALPAVQPPADGGLDAGAQGGHDDDDMDFEVR